MLVAALLWYRTFCRDLESIGFIFNPFDPCVANRIIRSKQHTIRFHVNDVMSSHVNERVNSMFLQWMNRMYGEHGEVKATWGKRHDYLGMTFDFSMEGTVKVDMSDYMKKMVSEFKEKYKLDGTIDTPAGADLFGNKAGELLLNSQKELVQFLFVVTNPSTCGTTWGTRSPKTTGTRESGRTWSIN